MDYDIGSNLGFEEEIVFRFWLLQDWYEYIWSADCWISNWFLCRVEIMLWLISQGNLIFTLGYL